MNPSCQSNMMVQGMPSNIPGEPPQYKMLKDMYKPEQPGMPGKYPDLQTQKVPNAKRP